MENFIYDYYGYNINQITNGSFEFKNYIFSLAATSENEETMEKLNQLVQSLYPIFNGDIVYLVKNKYNKYISTSKDDNNICLLTYKKDANVQLNSFIKMHLSFLNQFNYQVKIEEIISLWDQRLEYIQNQCLVNLNFDNDAHLALYEYTLYAIGLALNALQYLSDIHIDFQRKYYSSTLTHRRIKKMDKFELFNPFNLIIDHSSRDLAELYKNQLIDFSTLIKICSQYQYSIDEYEYLLARLFYPTFIFDIVEDIATDTTSYDYSSDIYYAISKQNQQLDKVKEFYHSISQYMNIRPIEWIKDFVK